MPFLAGLLAIYGILWLLYFLGVNALADNKLKGSIAAALCFIAVGTAHFIYPEPFKAAIFANWPHKAAINYISGVAEIILGLGLLFPDIRYYAGIGLIVLLIAVFPANINMAMVNSNFSNVFRLFFQPVYIFWIYWFCVRRPT